MIYVLVGLYLHSDGDWIQSLHRTHKGALAEKKRLEDLEEAQYGDEVDRSFYIEERDLVE